LTAKPGGGIADPSAHVDGEVDVRALGSEACGRCHADGGRVPPGGSHPAHAGFACATCHPVPERPYTPGHMDGRVEITLATGTFREGRCADAPCHGSRSTPTWGRPETVPGCGSCHGNPPEGHSDMPCANCHPGGAAHANGRVDFAFPDNCGGCHLAEPESGAHRAHRAGTEAAVIPCTTCHHVPDRVDAPGHLGPPPADVALTTGVYQDGTCTNTACHAEAGAANPAPRWDQGPEASRCGACHGVPPPDHWVWPCAQCHSSVIDADNHIIAPERHVNGRVDFR
jgi:predicted CxxxxCH...CXXCH cytochrome family protein